MPRDDTLRISQDAYSTLKLLGTPGSPWMCRHSFLTLGRGTSPPAHCATTARSFSH